jgi:hypothetical protein
MSVFVKDNILYWNSKPAFQYLDIVDIPMCDIFSVLDGNIKAKYKNRIVHGLSKGGNDKYYKVQLIKLL